MHMWVASHPQRQIYLALLLVSLAGCGPRQATLASSPRPAVIVQVTPEPTISPTDTSMPTQLATTPQPPTPTYAAVAPVDVVFYSGPEYVEQMRQQLLRTDLDPETRQGMEKLLWIADGDAIIAATASVLPPPTRYGSPTPDPLEPTPPHGIFEGHGGPFSPSEFDVHNMWQDEIDGYWWVVFAGADGQDRTQGMIVALKIVERVPTKTEGGRYDIPGKTGFARITAVTSMQVSLVAEDGSTYTFDLNKRAFATP